MPPEPSSLSACPTRETLIGFHQGRLDFEELERVARHVAECDSCLKALENLLTTQESDPLLARLQGQAAAEPMLVEDGCARLEQGAQGLWAASTEPSGGTSPDKTSSQREESWVGKVIGKYLILDRIHQGGMGVVYKALQLDVNREVALKMILGGRWAGKGLVQRFRTEGQAVARLKHPNVVQIHVFDQHEGLPYYTMELMAGGSLTGRLNNDPLEQAEAARLLATLAGTVDFAHRQQVVHRDLKPGNILFTDQDIPKISDFGLAKLLDQEDGQTRTEQVLGTPSYMAPEQAAGAPLGPPADIWALGVILYETLTGEVPFRGRNKAHTLRLVRKAEPEPPSSHNPDLNRGLDAICIKCLEKDPARRYPSAQALADDLNRWLTGEPTNVQPPGRLMRGWRFCKRHKTAIFAALVLLTVLAVAYYLDPNRPLRNMQSELAAGQKVTLIGPTGHPSWSRWLEGQEISQAYLDTDQTFSLQSLDLGLLQLLQEVPLQGGYRLQANVRTSKGVSLSHAGIFFCSETFRRTCGCTDLHKNWLRGKKPWRILSRNQNSPRKNIGCPATKSPFLFSKLFLCHGPE